MRPLLTLNPYFAKYRWRMLLGMLFVTLSNWFAVYLPEMVQKAIDLVGERYFMLTGSPATAYYSQIHEQCGWVEDIRDSGSNLGISDRQLLFRAT
jgi:hypothetical protein